MTSLNAYCLSEEKKNGLTFYFNHYVTHLSKWYLDKIININNCFFFLVQIAFEKCYFLRIAMTSLNAYCLGETKSWCDFFRQTQIRKETEFLLFERNSKSSKKLVEKFTT